MDAIIARKATSNWLKKAWEDHELEYKSIKAREHRETEAMWPTRGKLWVRKINSYIEKASAQGLNCLHEPNSCNPYGDCIIYIGKGDLPIYQKLMQFFRDKGFHVEEYDDMGMEITW